MPVGSPQDQDPDNDGGNRHGDIFADPKNLHRRSDACELRDDIREIVEELRGHILERATLDGEVSAAGVQAALANLGNPERLAREYVTDNLLARAEVSVVALANSPQAVSLGQFQFCRFLRFVGGRIRLSARGHAYVVRSIQNDSSPYCRAMDLRP